MRFQKLKDCFKKFQKSSRNKENQDKKNKYPPYEIC